MDLEVFLENAGLAHLKSVMLENDMTLHVLFEANNDELALFARKGADRIKLRSAIEKHRTKQKRSVNSETEGLGRAQQINETILPESKDLSYILDEGFELLDFELMSENLEEKESFQDPESSKHQQESSQNQQSSQDQESSQDEKSSEDQECCDEKKCGENLRQLLMKETIRKCLLEKTKRGHGLNCRDRAYIVKIVVEAELRVLEKLNNTIRKDVWIQWANEIAELFKGEPRNLYYVPYHVVGGKVVQASGLIHNRLITHRRSLAYENHRKRANSDSSDSGRSSSDRYKRVRPLPDEFKANEESSASLEESLDWLKGSSSPHNIVIAKWQATFDLRAKLLESGTYLEYFNTFPALTLPNGYQLLAADFQSVYPSANATFGERFPLIKLKLLKLLAEKGESSRVDKQTVDLLELASVGEEQANVAAFLGIVTLLRQMPTICVPKKKVWKLSREEARNGFLARVTSASEVETYCIQREMLFIAKGIPNQPFILAVGPSWANISQYEIVINKNLRYQLKNVCLAVMHTYNIYWALDCAYPKDSAPCWMLIQRAMFRMTSKYDTEGVPLRELLKQLELPTN